MPCSEARGRSKKGAPPKDQPELATLRLPWGGCTLTANLGGTQYSEHDGVDSQPGAIGRTFLANSSLLPAIVINVPGTLEEADEFGEAEWIFKPCPFEHCQGYIYDHRYRFRCGHCKVWAHTNWTLVVSHTRECCGGLSCRKVAVLGE
jgi:hypothetical protein